MNFFNAIVEKKYFVITFVAIALLFLSHGLLNFKLDLLDNKEHTLTVNRTGHNEKDKQILSIINY